MGFTVRKVCIELHLVFFLNRELILCESILIFPQVCSNILLLLLLGMCVVKRDEWVGGWFFVFLVGVLPTPYISLQAVYISVEERRSVSFQMTLSIYFLLYFPGKKCSVHTSIPPFQALFWLMIYKRCSRCEHQIQQSYLDRLDVKSYN